MASLALVFGIFRAAGVSSLKLVAQTPQPEMGVRYAQISQNDMKEWLGYLASDELQRTYQVKDVAQLSGVSVRTL